MNTDLLRNRKSIHILLSFILLKGLFNRRAFRAYSSITWLSRRFKGIVRYRLVLERSSGILFIGRTTGRRGSAVRAFIDEKWFFDRQQGRFDQSRPTISSSTFLERLGWCSPFEKVSDKVLRVPMIHEFFSGWGEMTFFGSYKGVIFVGSTRFSARVFGLVPVFRAGYHVSEIFGKLSGLRHVNLCGSRYP